MRNMWCCNMSKYSAWRRARAVRTGFDAPWLLAVARYGGGGLASSKPPRFADCFATQQHSTVWSICVKLSRCEWVCHELHFRSRRRTALLCHRYHAERGRLDDCHPMRQGGPAKLVYGTGGSPTATEFGLRGGYLRCDCQRRHTRTVEIAIRMLRNRFARYSCSEMPSTAPE
jgi:hypothetical protein